MRRLLFIIVVCTLGTGVTNAQQANERGAATATKSRSSASPSASSSRTTTAPSAVQPRTTIPRSTAAPRNSTASTAKRKTTIPAVTTPRSAAQNTVRPVKPIAVEVPKVQWLTIEEALEKSKTEKRKIFIDVYTDWCGWCKHMDSTTFTDPAVAAYLNEKYYAVKFNAEQAGDITYKAKTYKFKKNGDRGFHELASLWLNNRLSYPTSVFLNEDQDIIQPIPGYQDASKMDAILHYFGTDSHKKTPWEKYEKNYVREDLKSQK